MINRNAYMAFIFLIFIGTSCSSDDDAGPTGPSISNQVFGTWNLSIIIQNNQIDDNFPCEEDIEYTFNSNGTYSKRVYSTDANQNCVVATTTNGNWEAIEDNIMQLNPFSASSSSETLDISLRNNGNQLQIIRSSNLTELYNKN